MEEGEAPSVASAISGDPTPQVLPLLPLPLLISNTV